MFITNDELKANETIQKCKKDFPQFETGKFYILRSEVTAFDRDNKEGIISFDGYSGVLVCFEEFSAQGNAHFIEPVFLLQQDGSLKQLDGLCEQSFYIPASWLNAADFEPFIFEESEYVKPDDALEIVWLKAESHALNEGIAIPIICFLLFVLGIAGIVAYCLDALHNIPRIAVFGVSILCILLALLLAWWYMENGDLRQREEVRAKTASQRYKRLADFKKYSEKLGIDPCVSVFLGCMGIRLSTINKENV